MPVLVARRRRPLTQSASFVSQPPLFRINPRSLSPGGTRKGPVIASAMPSLNALLQTESLEKIKGNADELMRLARQFPNYTAIADNPTVKDDFGAMLKLSGDIQISLDKIASLRQQPRDTNPPSTCLPSAPVVVTKRKRHRHEKHPRRALAPVCHNCDVNYTPIWRMGLSGSTFCNVCGLIYANRERRHAKLRAAGRHKTHDAAMDQSESAP